MSRRFVISISLALLAMLRVAMTRASAVDLTINGAQKFQVIDGFGVNINVNSWNNRELRVQADNTTDFSSPLINVRGLATSAYTPGRRSSDGTYVWRVQAMDGTGNASQPAVADAGTGAVLWLEINVLLSGRPGRSPASTLRRTPL